MITKAEYKGTGEGASLWSCPSGVTAPWEWLARQGQERTTSPLLIIRFPGRHGAIPMATHIFLSCMITDGTVSPNSQEKGGGVIRSMGLRSKKPLGGRQQAIPLRKCKFSMTLPKSISQFPFIACILFIHLFLTFEGVFLVLLPWHSFLSQILPTIIILSLLQTHLPSDSKGERISVVMG